MEHLHRGKGPTSPCPLLQLESGERPGSSTEGVLASWDRSRGEGQGLREGPTGRYVGASWGGQVMAHHRLSFLEELWSMGKSLPAWPLSPWREAKSEALEVGRG